MTDTLDLDTLVLSPGKHETRDDGLCAMEAVAWLAGEEHTDRPRCVSPVLATYARVLNDAMSDDERQRLVPYLPRLIGTAGDAEADQRRGYLAADAAVRVLAPLAFDAAGFRDEAETLRNLAPVTDTETAQVARTTAHETARTAAADAAAWAAADAADAAELAAKDAAWGTADAATHVAKEAVLTAQRAAQAAEAARAAAGAEPTPVWDAALDLLDRLIDA